MKQMKKQWLILLPALLVLASCGAERYLESTTTAATAITATAAGTITETDETDAPTTERAMVETDATTIKRGMAATVATTAATATSTATTSPTTMTTTTTASKPADQPGSATYSYSYPGIAPVVAKAPADPYLICVNRNYHLPANYSPALQVCVEAYPEKIKMETTAATQYKKMYNAAKAEGAELIPYSGYRSNERQKANFERLIQTNVDRGYSYTQAVNIAAQSILPPGCTEHSAGLAMDITRPGVWDTSMSFDTTKEFAWLTAHAHEYGFIMRYPKDKFAITQITYEPWHWRYVGVGPATAMKQSGQCLEEYLGLN